MKELAGKPAKGEIERKVFARIASLSSLVVFVAFFVNVLMGSYFGYTFLSDVGEFLVLFLASVLFVIAILAHEACEH